MVAGPATGAGSLIGMLVGVLGGPVGLLLGWGTGALICGAVYVRRAEQIDEQLVSSARRFRRAAPRGSRSRGRAEPAVEVIDGEMRKLGGALTHGKAPRGSIRCLS